MPPFETLRKDGLARVLCGTIIVLVLLAIFADGVSPWRGLDKWLYSLGPGYFAWYVRIVAGFMLLVFGALLYWRVRFLDRVDRYTRRNAMLE